MAITSLSIVQDNIVGGYDLLAVHSPLKFLAEITDNDSPYSFPEYLNVEVTDLLTATTYTGYKAWQYEKVSDKARFIFNSEKILRDIMGDFSDVDGDSIDYPNFLVRQFRVKFIYLALNDYVDFFGYACSRQVGQTECVTQVASNADDSIIAFANREFYMHYYAGGVADEVVFDGVTVDAGGIIRKRKTISTVGTSTAVVLVGDVELFTTVYGYLYNKVAANNVKLIPTAMSSDGWHLPNEAEWMTLISYTGLIGSAGDEILKLFNCRQVNSPSPECDTTTHPRWNYSLSHGTNLYDLSLSPGGSRYTDGSFAGIGDYAEFHSNLGIVKFFSNEYETEILGFNYGANIRLMRSATTQELLLPDGIIEQSYYTGNDTKKYINIKVGTQVWTPNLAETKFNDDSNIPIVTDGTAWSNLTSIDNAMCLYDNNNAYLGATEWAYYTAKTFNILTLPNDACGLYVKFLDSNTGYYKHWLFSRYFEIQSEHEAYGTVENFSLNLLQGAELEIGKKFKRKFLISADLTQAEMDYIKGLLSSPRIYYLNEDDKWISVKLDNSTNTLRYPKNNTGVQMFTLVEASQNTVTML